MTPAERAERIVQVAKANPDALLADLALACERSEAWTRKVLKQAGIVPATRPRAPRSQKPAGRNRDATVCRCSHRRDEHCPPKFCNHHRRSPIGVTFKLVEHCLRCGCTWFQGPEKANGTTPCKKCGHPRNGHCWTKGKRQRGQGPHTDHFSPDGAWFQCLSNHCCWFNVHDGIRTPCECPNFVDPYAKATGRRKKAPPAPVPAQMELTEETETNA
jgi:hypothetical protein